MPKMTAAKFHELAAKARAKEKARSEIDSLVKAKQAATEKLAKVRIGGSRVDVLEARAKVAECNERLKQARKAAR